MTRYEFIEALLLACRAKFGGDRHADGRKYSASECLAEFCGRYILPLARKLSSGPLRQLMRRRDMLVFLLSIEKHLRCVFDWYAALSARVSRGA